MKFRIYILLICVLILGCNKKIRPEKPSNLIAKDKMVDILFDLYIINGAKNVNKTLMEKMSFDGEKYVYNKHDIDSLQFANSNAYYAYDIEGYTKMVEKARDRLEKEKDKAQTLQKEEQKKKRLKQDSIKKANQKSKKGVLDTTKLKVKPRQKKPKS